MKENSQADIKQLNRNQTDILVTLQEHGTILEYIKEQTTRTNGRVLALEREMQVVTPAIEMLKLDKAAHDGAAQERRRLLTNLATPFIIAAILAILKVAGILNLNFTI